MISPSVRTKRVTLPVLLLALALVGALLAAPSPAMAQSEGPVVQGVLFFDPSCPNCEAVMEDVLPPLEARYGPQFKMYRLDVSFVEVFDAWSRAAKAFDLPAEKKGVPLMVIDDRILSGKDEIGAELPGIISEGMSSGGIAVPAAVGLSEEDLARLEAASLGGEAAEKETDPVANGLAILVLGGMVVSLAYVGAGSFRTNIAIDQRGESRGIGYYAIPILSVLGMAVAGYLSYVKLTSSPTLCPIGNCDAVQHSQWSQLIGVPVAYLGFLSYAAILVLWVAWAAGSGRLPGIARFLLFIVAIIGTLFSAYLTFLEPVIIKEVCLWCLLSAVIMTLILLASFKELTPQSQAVTAGAPVEKQRSGKARRSKTKGKGKRKRR